mmetsp:Transcript_30648/g.73502  ORF Transcript_30648/g.73502 Transcript_30648/m.73502 type:complete len:154 (-) Transcript_30648:2685-3146(-)
MYGGRPQPLLQAVSLKEMEHSYSHERGEPQEYMVPLSGGGLSQHSGFGHQVPSNQGIPMRPTRSGRTPPPTMYGGRPQPMEVGRSGLSGTASFPPRSESQYSNEKQSSDFSQDGEIEPIVLWNVTLPLGLSRYENMRPSIAYLKLELESPQSP